MPDARIGADSRVVAAREQVSCEVDGQTVILSLSGGVYYGLDAVGASVWRMIETPRTVAELRDAVVEAYEVDADTAERDLRLLLDDLAARGLVDVRPAD